jgi:replication factor A2
MFGASQGFGYGDATAPTQDAPKRARQEDKQTCIPVTVRVLQDAVSRHADSQEVLIHGTEASIVSLVGVVESLVEQSTMLEFQLNDGSGRMKVRYYSTGAAAVEGLAAGRYVNVVGNLRTAPSAHVSAMSIRQVTAADEVSYHMIEVAHAAVSLRNPTKSAPFAASTAAVDPITPAKQGLGMGFTAAPASTLSPAKVEAPAPTPEPPAVPLQTPPKADLRSSVLSILQQVNDSGNEEGINVSGLLAKLAPGQATSQKVQDVMSQLVQEGDVFNTIDEQHFAVL